MHAPVAQEALWNMVRPLSPRRGRNDRFGSKTDQQVVTIQLFDRAWSHCARVVRAAMPGIFNWRAADIILILAATPPKSWPNIRQR
jgi:hypothetical protein